MHARFIEFAVPRIGGVAIIIAMLIGALPAFLVDGDLRMTFSSNPNNQFQLLTMLVAACSIFAIGLLDDLLKFAQQDQTGGAGRCILGGLSFGRVDSSTCL